MAKKAYPTRVYALTATQEVLVCIVLVGVGTCDGLVPPEMVFSAKHHGNIPPRPLLPEQDLAGARQVEVTDEEIAHFKKHGFLVKRGLIPKEDLDPFVEMWWQQPPVTEAGLKREDPKSWIYPGNKWPKEQCWGCEDNWMLQPGQSWPSASSERPGAMKGDPIYRQPHKLSRDPAGHVWRWHGIGHDPAFVNATSAHPNVLHVVEALLGGSVKRPKRNRGIYTVFPRGNGTDVKEQANGLEFSVKGQAPTDAQVGQTRLNAHADAVPTELMAVTNLVPIGPKSGGFTFWPGSAQLLYPTSQQAHNWVPTNRSEQVMMEDILPKTQPWEFVGGPGDVVFAHGLTVHSAGIQQSPNPRLAVVQDFNKVRLRGPMRWAAAGKNGGKGAYCGLDGVFRLPTDDPNDDPADGDREVHIPWHTDNNEFTLDQVPPFEDMWAEWNLGKHPVVGDVQDEPAWWEKYELPMLPSSPSEGGVHGGGGTPAVPLSRIADYEGDGVWRARSWGNGAFQLAKDAQETAAAWDRGSLIETCSVLGTTSTRTSACSSEANYSSNIGVLDLLGHPSAMTNFNAYKQLDF